MNINEEIEIYTKSNPKSFNLHKTGKKVMNFLRNLNKKGKTIVLITHDTDLIKGYADIAYWLKDGKVSKVTKGSM